MKESGTKVKMWVEKWHQGIAEVESRNTANVEQYSKQVKY